MYKLKEFNILEKETGKYIPYDESNKDYKKYLEWLSEGNIPEPFETQEEIDARLLIEEELAIMKKIEDRMKEIAIEDLKSKGEIPLDYKLKK